MHEEGSMTTQVPPWMGHATETADMNVRMLPAIAVNARAADSRSWAFTLHSLVAERGERGCKENYRSVWTFVSIIMAFRGKVAVITGGVGGMGRGLALRLAAQGAKIAIVDLDEAALNATAAKVKQKAHAGSYRPLHKRR
jgi:alanine dehydrogenase